MKIELKNNLAKFEADFKKDVGIDSEDNILLFYSYCNARLSDINSQLLNKILEVAINIETNTDK